VYARVKTFDNINPLVRDLTLAALFAALTALGAQIAIRLPFSPVPVTLQVLMVIGSGLVLGSRRGLASQLTYLAVGVLGVPIFAGGTGGPAVILGPTGGYLLSFPVAAFTAGWLSERSKPGRRLGRIAASLAALILIYLGGASWLAVWLVATGAPSLPAALAGAWHLGVAPFFLADLAKAILAVVAIQGAYTLLPWVGSAGPAGPAE
jgi:biotin transport system substrate-specific component